MYPVLLDQYFDYIATTKADKSLYPKFVVKRIYSHHEENIFFVFGLNGFFFLF